MGKDVEEGEISDTASVEEISEADFNIKQNEINSFIEPKPKGETDGRVWTMRDLYNNYSKYPTVCRGYGPGLHNLAWAQAVQNKPLNEIFVMDVEQDDVSKRSSPSSSVASVNSSGGSKDEKKEVEKVVIDDSGDEIEKEEGELEEGEIDLESESNDKVTELVNEEVKSVNVDSIREALESVVNVVDVDESFHGVCSKLQNTLESLREVGNENNVPLKEALIRLAFSAVQSVHFVFCSMNYVLKEQNRDILCRLLFVIKNYDPPLFSSDQIKEIETMVLSLGARVIDKEKDIEAVNGVNSKDYNALAENVASDLTYKNKFPLPVDSSVYNKPLEALKPAISGYRSRGILLPLLDLHKVHDADSLPSPTRETTPCIPVQQTLAGGDGMVKLGSAAAKVTHDTENDKILHYETDALRAVSYYQQKFGSSTFFSNDRLPSPTPSEESGDGGGDTGGEISSTSTVDKLKPVNPPILGQQAVSSQHIDNSNIQGLASANNLASVNSVSNSVVKSNPVVKASVKSRDPRLRFANPDALDLNHWPVPMVHNAPKAEPVGGVTSSRKQKTVEEPVLDAPAPKRKRNGFENSGIVRNEKTVSGGGGWLEDTDMVGPQLMNKNQLVDSVESNPRKLDNRASGNELVPVTIPCTTASLPALLKDIAVNPTMLLNILRMGQQQKLTAEAQQKSNNTPVNTMYPPSSSSSSSMVAAPLVNVAPSGNLPKPMGAIQVPQAVPMDELGKIRMKPRDPRRFLHGNTLQKSGSLVPELSKMDGSSTPSIQGRKDNFNSQSQQGQAEAKPVYSQPPPNIAWQFTKSLKDIADFMSVSQPLTNQPVVPQNLPAQPGQTKLEADMKAVVSTHDSKRAGTASGPEVGPVCPHSQGTWGDVEHLFEGYDDQQKAAIQRERARRIEEQKKMFGAHKLCLVLDLDHTLLNSAKFNEVNPVHDEILRKKEEQDREKPQRHLFRFPHLGMWTKLRPGIWTFLERASELFELHLYTMGNKLYATEMAKVLDPTGALFAGRVISRGDDGDPFDGDERIPRSKDLEGVLGMESAVVIIDDSVRVWPHNKLNLIVVERYTYFPCSRRQFGLIGPSLLEIDHDERPEDGTLASSLAVIERIHKIFFSHQALDDVDVRNILATEQRKILAGCRIVFSRVFPVGETNPHLHPLWQTAEQFGAVCTKQIDEQVTHVVANSHGTDKVNWAVSTGRFVVHPGWVEASALLYRRANEQDFAIKP